MFLEVTPRADRTVRQLRARMKNKENTLAVVLAAN
jgi:hypothetical protein